MEKLQEVNTKPSELPDMELEFDVEVEGEMTRKKYLGTFTTRILNRKNRAGVDKHRAFLNGPNQVGLGLDILHLHHRIAYLKFALVEPYPKFWTESGGGYELYDGNVVDAIFDEVLAFEETWMRKVWGDEAVDKMKSGGKK